MSIGWVAAGASIVSGVVGSRSASKAADRQADATEAAAEAQRDAEREALALQKPTYEAGDTARNRLLDLLGLSKNTTSAGFGSLNQQFQFNPNDLQNDPGFQFQAQQGQNAINRRAAAGGSFYSGAGLQAAANFNQDLAGTAYNNAYNRNLSTFQTNRQNTLNPLQALAGQGQSAANAAGQIQVGTGNALSNLYSSLGNAQGAAAISQGNSLNNAIGTGLGAWQQAQYLNQLRPQQAVAGGGMGGQITLAGSNAGYNFGFPW